MKWYKIQTVIWLFVLPMISNAQISQTIKSAADTSNIITIPLEDIPIISLQATIKLDKLKESIITEDQIAADKAKSDSILSDINKLLAEEEKVNFDSLLSRNLVNRSNFWMGYKEVLEEQISTTENTIFDLSSKRKEVIRELRLWVNTKSLMDSVYTDSLYSWTINDVILQAENLDRIILSRTKVFFSILKSLQQNYVRVDNLLIEIKNINRLRQERIFEKTHPSILGAGYTEQSNWYLLQKLKLFQEENMDILTRFYLGNTTEIFLFAGYMAVLIGIFLFLMGKSDSIILSKSNVYQRSVATILKRPISVAIILGIFSSGLFFHDRPPILIDLSILVLTIPIIDIVAHVSNKRGKIYLITFAVLIMLRFINYIFPPVTPFHRLNLLLMGSLEIIILILLFRTLNIRKITHHAFNQFVRFIILIHIIASITGIIANITGHLRLAEIAIDLSITNTLVGLLLIISTVVIIGLLQLLVDSKYLKKFNYLNKRRQLFKKRIVTIMTSIAALLWINYILQILRVNDIFYHFILSMLNTKISVGTATFSMGSVLLFFFIIWLSVIISDMIRAVLEDDVLNRVSLKKGVPRMISVIVRFSLISIGIFLAVSAVGMPLNQLTIIISAFSVGIGFGLQNVVNNFVSGIVLLFERPVQIGDAVEVNNLIGSVKSMGIRSSNIRTFDGAEVIVPNANLISNEVINWTLSDKKRRIEIFSGVAYGSDVHQVKEILLGILKDHPDILKEPEPLVLFNDLGESSLDFRLLFWIDNFDKWIIIKSEIIFKIHDALMEAKIKIPFPQRDLHIISKNTE
jgi:small-conductance mechanosensitive channel